MNPEISHPGHGARCLSCRRADQLVRVVAVVRQERVVHDVRVIACESYGSPMPVRARAVRTSALAAALAPPRRRRAPMLASAVVIVVAMGSVMNMIAALAAADVGGLLAAVVGICLAACGAWWVIRRRKDVVASATLINRARWLWRRCWYCRRCGVVSLLMPNGSTTLPVTGLGPALVALASRLKWRPVTVRPGMTNHRHATPSQPGLGAKA